MLSSILSISILLTMLLAGYGVGRPLLRVLMCNEEQDPSSVVIWSLFIGWIFIGLLLTTLGVAGLLYRVVIGIGTLIAAFFGVGEIARAILDHTNQDQSVPEVIRQMLRFPKSDTTLNHGSVPSPWMLVLFITLAGIAATASLIGALAPVTAGDALCYHLELPKRFIEASGFVYLPHSDNSTYPLLVEMWYLWAMILRGAVIDGAIAAQLVHWMCGIMLATGTFTLAYPILGPRWSILTAATVLITPGVTNQMTAPLNDVALALMTTMAIAAWWRFAVNREGFAWCVLSGIAAGGALGTKYIAALFAIACFAAWFWMFVHQKERRDRLLKGAMLIGGLAIVVGGVWYARAYKYRGNPVYPFFNELHQISVHSKPSEVEGAVEGTVEVVSTGPKKHRTTPESFLNFTQKISQKQSVHLKHNRPKKRDAAEATGLGKFETLPERKTPLGRSPLAFFSAPWQISINPDRFGGRSHQLGILFLAGLPGLFFVRRLRGLGTLLAVGAVYFSLWFLLRQNVRFLFPILPLLCVGLVWVWIEMTRMPKSARFLSMAVFVFVLLMYTGVSVRRSLDRLPVAIGLESHRDYLLRCEPSYGIARQVNRIVGAHDHLLSQDVRHYYFKCPITQEKVFHREVPYDRVYDSAYDSTYDSAAAEGGGLLRMLRQAGFSHVLLVQNQSDQGEAFDPSLLNLLKTEPRIQLEQLETVDDPDGGQRQYFLASIPKKSTTVVKK